jgi:hypothetical protein
MLLPFNRVKDDDRSFVPDDYFRFDFSKVAEFDDAPAF